ncbi:3370_t:CDS:2, partial [Acaulospora morrowiae]
RSIITQFVRLLKSKGYFSDYQVIASTKYDESQFTLVYNVFLYYLLILATPQIKRQGTLRTTYFALEETGK